MIVDYFPFFAEYGVETLKLRYEMLKDYVDIFVVSESNKTHSGLDTERKFPQILADLNLPEEKFIYVLTEIPETEDLQILNIDILNSIGNSEKLDSQRARARERLQKDALLFVLNEFEDDTVFIHSDMDEIIKPWAIDYLARVCRENQDIILKIPLVHCEARADLRIHVKETEEISDWSGGMFLATKKQLMKVTPTQIRSGHQNTYPISYVTENGVRCEDLGWHFSWMGNSLKRKIKANSWAHYNDAFSWMNFNSFSDETYHDFAINTEFKDGSLPPSGNKACVLRTYPLDQLPKEIFEHKMLKDYFLPEQTYSTEPINKLKNFPTINVMSTNDEDGNKRSDFLTESLNDLNVTYKIHKMEKYPHCVTNIISNIDMFSENIGNKGINIFGNHVRMIRDWYENTTEEVGFFCEDDLSFETVNYWNFTWDEFYNRLPKNWDIVQLCVVTDSNNLDYDLSLQIKLNGHYWGMNAYLLKRSYAKKILDTYCTDDKDTFNIYFEYPITSPLAIPEDLFYTLNGRVYYAIDNNGNMVSLTNDNLKDFNKDTFIAFQYICDNIYVIPMFTENTDFNYHIGLDMHRKCHEYTLDLWRKNSET